MAIKAKEIAKAIGVSEATLSLVLNGKPGISDKTRVRVLNQIKELGYAHLIPDQTEAMLASLVSANTLATPAPVSNSVKESGKALGFVLYKSNGELLGMNSFFPLILEGLEATAREYGYSLVIINIERDQVTEQIQYIRDTDCVGYTIFATEMDSSDIPYFDGLGLPYVLLDNYFIERDINSVKVNNQQGTYSLVQHLAEQGHTKIGYLSSGLPIRSFKERENCALDAIRHFTGVDASKYVYEIGYPHDRAETGMNNILSSVKKENLPTAFMADNDLVAVGGMLAAKRAGYKVPEDFSFVGYDDRPICTLVDPPLTTLRLPRERFGAEAIHQLIRLIQKSSSSTVKVEINGKLIIRNSTS